MSREIKFRAWDKNDRKMFYSNKEVTVWAGGLEPSINTDNGKIMSDFELMQFTGLRDKNGKEIYESDLVKWDDRSNGKYWRVAVVKINPDIQFDIIKNSLHALSTEFPHTFYYGNFIYADTENHLEIIGNIYENENLLK